MDWGRKRGAFVHVAVLPERRDRAECGDLGRAHPLPSPRGTWSGLCEPQSHRWGLSWSEALGLQGQNFSCVHGGEARVRPRASLALTDSHKQEIQITGIRTRDAKLVIIVCELYAIKLTEVGLVLPVPQTANQRRGEGPRAHEGLDVLSLGCSRLAHEGILNRNERQELISPLSSPLGR